MKKQITARLEKANRKRTSLTTILAIGFCLFLSNFSFAQDMQTIRLNTAYNHTNQNLFNVGNLDLFWSVGTLPGTSLRSGFVISPAHPAWVPAAPNSQWISLLPAGNSIQGTTQYVYQKCFCLKPGYNNPNAIPLSSLSIGARADDIFYVGLNQIPNPANPTTYFMTSNGSSGPGFYNNNLLLNGGVVTGLNLVGNITLSGIDEVRKNFVIKPNLLAVPRGYSNCSFCAKRIIDLGPTGYKDTLLRNNETTILRTIGINPTNPSPTGSEQNAEDLLSNHDVIVIKLDSAKREAVMVAETAEEAVRIALQDFPDSVGSNENLETPSGDVLLVRFASGGANAVLEDSVLFMTEVADAEANRIDGVVITTISAR
jgi:hypothetical protein